MAATVQGWHLLLWNQPFFYSCTEFYSSESSAKARGNAICRKRITHSVIPRVLFVGIHGLSFHEPFGSLRYLTLWVPLISPYPRFSLISFLISSSISLKEAEDSAMAGRKAVDFEDYLPTMAEKLGGEGLIAELCNGFRLLMDPDKEIITFESLKRNSALLGLQGLSDDELISMLREGDMDGDGALNQMEFCVLMFRLSPELMEESECLLEEALLQELKNP